MSKAIQVGKLTQPGETICTLDSKIVPGNGVIIKESRFVAVLRGNIHISAADEDNIQTLSIVRNEKKRVGINLEDEVLARVIKIKDETVFVNIVCVNN